MAISVQMSMVRIWQEAHAQISKGLMIFNSQTPLLRINAQNKTPRARDLNGIKRKSCPLAKSLTQSLLYMKARYGLTKWMTKVGVQGMTWPNLQHYSFCNSTGLLCKRQNLSSFEGRFKPICKGLRSQKYQSFKILKD